MELEELPKGILRRKTIPIEVYNPNPVYVKSSIDLLLLGIGTTLGYGIYFLIGSVARTTGPAALISVTIAAISSILSALCYIEFTSRLPKASSPYFYTYIQINEIVAFSFGWNMILEYAIGAASFARGLSAFLRFELYNEYPCKSLGSLFSCKYDYQAVIIILIVTLVYTWGVKELPRINDAITVLNIITICVILVAGFTVYDTSNWSIPKGNHSEEISGSGGFMPFGVNSIIFAAAKYFYLFIGFGCITTTAEQITKPDFKIPFALTICLVSSYIFYMLVATCLILMVPYYQLDPVSPITEAFAENDMTVIKWIVIVGAILAILNAIFCVQLPLTRTVYTMGIDGLVCRCLGKLNERTRTPANATIFCGCVSAVAALIFDIDDLIELTSLGTLFIRCLGAIIIIMIHYRPVKEVIFVNVTCWRIFKQLVIYSDFDDPNLFTADVVFYAMIAFTILSTILSMMFSYSYLFGSEFDIPHIIICCVIIYLLLHVMVLIARQPKPRDKLKFKVPLSPLVPCLSIFLNILLMIHLAVFTWLRFGVWMFLGFLIYFYYGIKESAELTGSHRHLITRGTQYEDISLHPPIAVESRDSTMVPHIEEKEAIMIDLDRSRGSEHSHHSNRTNATTPAAHDPK